MARKSARDVKVDNAWDVVLDRLPALNNFVDSIDHVREAVAAAAGQAVKELEKAIAAGAFPEHWRNPRIELRSTGYAVRMGLQLKEFLDIPSITIDTSHLPAFRLSDVFDLSQLKLEKLELIPVDAALLAQSRRAIKPIPLEFALPLGWFLTLGVHGFVTDTLLQCVRILVHAPLLEDALLANNAAAATMHVLALSNSALRLALLPQKRGLAGLAKARARAGENYGGSAPRAERDARVRAAILSAHRREPSRSLTTVLRLAHADVLNCGIEISFSTLERIARNCGIKAGTIASLAQGPGPAVEN